MTASYPDFFLRVTAHRPLPYQARYGENPFSPTLLIVPTGLGKTQAVLVPWLYSRAVKNEAAPTRLIIVLPRQNLTAQTADTARQMTKAAGLEGRVQVLELMASSADNEAKLGPNDPAIIVSTQDLYFSRALNRGYARRPPRWPIDFALYNQDCLIVLDEIQLMDDALATSTQLAAFREQFGTIGQAPCVWMSATLNPNWLETYDFGRQPIAIRLNDADFAEDLVQKRVHARKLLGPAPEQCRTPPGCAEFALSRHKPGTRTLIIANTVVRAREICAALRFEGAILLHSRFRPVDRKRASNALISIPPEGQIVVSTQVLEAGVDISARLLVTDIAPWGSLVQRFGRVNRYGYDTDAEIWWVDRPSYAKQKDPTAPYSAAEIERALERVANLTSAAPSNLPDEDGPEPWNYVLRRADLLDLFDTTPDLSGNDLDVSRFIRATDDKNVYLAWREWDGAVPSDLDELGDEELCPIPIGDLREFEKKHPVFTWNFALDKWVRVDRDRLFPGMILVTRTAEGGYTAAEGWSPDSKAKVELARALPNKLDGDSSDKLSFGRYRQTLRDHTDRVLQELEVLLSGSDNLEEAHAITLRAAAAKHDWGKAHPVFQATLHRHDDSPDLLAKQIGEGKHSRPHFRHELASAMAMLQSGDSDLAAYLVAAHHGKVRLGIRSMPGEKGEADVRFARGIRQGDHLPACEIATGLSLPPMDLSLAVMEFGAEGGSWTDRMLRVRDAIGPFRLAYLEMLLRAADEAASAKPHLEATVCTG